LNKRLLFDLISLFSVFLHSSTNNQSQSHSPQLSSPATVYDGAPFSPLYFFSKFVASEPSMDRVFNKLRNLDAYPKVNEDFYNRTLAGGVVTVVSAAVMFFLFISELSMILSSSF
jgi:hypothetical protein